jgi:hypothetical protein
MPENNFIRKHNDELKREYLRGASEANSKQKECTGKFLGLVKDRLSKTMDKAVTLEDAVDDIEEVIQLIDDYNYGEIPVDELIERETVDEISAIHNRLEKLETDGDEVISLTDFLND